MRYHLSRLAALIGLAVAAYGSTALAQEQSTEFYSGVWTRVDVDKQWLIKGFETEAFIKIECEGISNDSDKPIFLLVSDRQEYRWGITESGGAFMDVRTLSIREGGKGQVPYCKWSVPSRAGVKPQTLAIDVLPSDSILLGGFTEAREFSVSFQNDGGCPDLHAQIYIDGDPLVTVDKVEQKLTPDASFFGIGQTVEAKIEGTCPPNSIPVLLFSTSQ